MKNRYAKILGVLLLACAAWSSAELRADGSRGNYSTLVTVESAKAKDFIGVLMMMSSMPFEARLLGTNRRGNLSYVRVGISESWAREDGLDAFDVAKRLKGFVGGPYGVRAIRAQIRAPLEETETNTDSFRNVGTIGHR